MTKLWDNYLSMPDVLLIEAAQDSGNELAIALGKRLAREIEEKEQIERGYESEVRFLHNEIRELESKIDAAGES